MYFTAGATWVQAHRKDLKIGYTYTYMDTPQNTLLAPHTSLAVGGPAKHLSICTTTDSLVAALVAAQDRQLWLLGYGANSLVSDDGLPGTTILVRTTNISQEDNSATIIADAGVWWDDLVQFAVARNLWGLEFMSAIPGSVGAAIIGNIAAYGQAVADTLSWVEVFDRQHNNVYRLPASHIEFGYRHSSFQQKDSDHLVIVRAAFTLQPSPTKDLEYQAALDVVEEKQYDIATLNGRRQAILETRRRSGSLWDWRHPDHYLHTAGSFFRNPVVSDEAVEQLLAYEERDRTAAMIRKMNQIHGGSGKRVSAAHVLLAAGFHRGQSWGAVRLHPDHILKLENTGDASAQQIYNVAMEITRTVKAKLGIDIVPEVRFLGRFKENA